MADADFKITVESRKIIAKFGKWLKFTPQAVTDELNAIGLEVRNNIMMNMKKTKRARRKKGEDKKSHKASLPGNPPAIDSGRLVNSFEILSRKRSVEVGTNVVYAKWLQEGTKPYTIKTRKKHGLSDGTSFFGKKVQHPGIAARPFLESGMKGIDLKQRIMEAMERGTK